MTKEKKAKDKTKDKAKDKPKDKKEEIQEKEETIVSPEQELLNSLGFSDSHSVADLVDHNDGKYFIVNVIAKRAKDINLGNKPLVDTDDPTGECYPYAVAEIAQNKLKVVPKKAPNKLVDLINEK